MNNMPDSRARNCLIPKYIGSDFDHVINVSKNMDEVINVSDNITSIKLVNSKLDKIETVADNFEAIEDVSDNMEDIKDLASFVGKTEDHLIANMLKTEGYNVVGNATAGCLINNHQELVVHEEHIYRYIGSDIFPIRVSKGTNFDDGNWVFDSFRGSVKDWDTFDAQLLEAGGLPETDLNEPDSADKPSRLTAIANYVKSFFYKLPFLSKGSTTARSLEDRFSDVVNVKDFGVVGDGVTDDTISIQKAITFAYISGNNLVGFKGTSKISGTIYIPNMGSRHKSIEWDFKGLVLLFSDNVRDGVVSGKYINKQWISAMNDSVQNNMSFNFVIKNLGLRRAVVTDLQFVGTTGFKLKDFHQGCKFERLTTSNFFTGFYSYNTFYSDYDDCQVFNDEPATGAKDSVGFGFIWERQIALQNFYKLKAVNVAFGYTLKGFVTGTALDHCSFEGQHTAVVTQGEGDGTGGGEVYDLAITNGYVENIWGDTCFIFKNPANVLIDNTFFNPEFAVSGGVTKDSVKYVADAQAGLYSNIDYRNTNKIKAPISKDTIFKNKGATVSRLTLSAEQRLPDLSNYTLNTNGITTKIDQIILDIEGSANVQSIAKVNNGICEGNYSGRMTSGSQFGGKHGVFNFKHNPTNLEFDTVITPSDTQILYVHFKIQDAIGIKLHRGFIIDTEFVPLGSGGSTQGDVTVYQAEGFVRVIVQNLQKSPIADYVIHKAEVRII